MLNRDVFHTDPDQYRIANQGVAKTSFPPSPQALVTLRGELETFVCDGAYASGLARILEAFLASAGRARRGRGSRGCAAAAATTRARRGS